VEIGFISLIGMRNPSLIPLFQRWDGGIFENLNYLRALYNKKEMIKCITLL